VVKPYASSHRRRGDQLEFVKLFLADIDPAISVDSAVRTEDALRKLGESPYDCILCDYQMPEMNGVDLAKLIRAEKKTPIIITPGGGRGGRRSGVRSRG
jgi:CheY-like chemotaxis protein